MGKKLDPQQLELYRATDEVLHYIWDPIGISDSPYARDEYWGYLPEVFAMPLNENQEEKIAEYLLRIQSERMGLKPDEKNANRVVKILYEYKEKLL